MGTKQLIDSAVERLRTSASLKTVYGEPVVIDGKTVIPVAKVGAAGESKPVGVVEVRGDEARFVPVAQTKKLTIVAAVGSWLGLMFGFLLGRRSKS